MFPKKMVVRIENSGHNFAVPCPLCTGRLRPEDPEAVLYNDKGGAYGDMGVICPKCFEALNTSPSALSDRLNNLGVIPMNEVPNIRIEGVIPPNIRNEAGHPVCPECSRRDRDQIEADRNRESPALRRHNANHAVWLFAKRRDISKLSRLASTIGVGVNSDVTDFLPTLVRNIAEDCDGAIESYADEIQEQHPDLADGIRLLVSFCNLGGLAESEIGIDGKLMSTQYQAIITANMHHMDAETWQRMFECRDVIAELLEKTPAGPDTPDNGDSIPF